MLPIHTILHPTDFTEQSMHAFHLANALARDYHAHLIVLHVKHSPTLLFTEGEAVPTLESSEETLQDELAELHADVGVEMTRQIEEGDPADEILNLARVAHADLIVMGAHGRSPLARLVMGSVTAKVMRQSACPVFTVRAPFPPAETVATAAMEQSAAS